MNGGENMIVGNIQSQG